MFKTSLPIPKLRNETVLLKALLRLYDKPVDIERLRLLYAVEKLKTLVEKRGYNVTEKILRNDCIEFIVSRKDTSACTSYQDNVTGGLSPTNKT